jgi:DNA-binding transcriptional MerR regulator
VPYKKPKIEKVYFTIGEVSELIGVTPSSIRYWESNFEELSPQKSSKGTRYYSKENIETLKLIYHLVKERGLTIKGAKFKLKDNRQETFDNWEIVKRLKKVKAELIAIKEEMGEAND